MAVSPRITQMQVCYRQNSLFFQPHGATGIQNDSRSKMRSGRGAVILK